MLDTPHSDLPSPPAPLPGREEYSIVQAAGLLGVSRVSIWRWIRSGQLPATRLGPRTVRIKRADLEQLMAQRATASPWSRVLGRPDPGMACAEADVPGPHASWTTLGPSEHVVQFYDADGALLDAVSGYIGAAVQAGDVGILIATAAHRAGIEERLERQGGDVEKVREAGQYIALDAIQTLSKLMDGGMPDAGRFDEVIGGLVAEEAARGRRVRAFGEMVALLALEGNYAGAVALEGLWNDLQGRYPFALFCAYPMACLGEAGLGEALHAVCGHHTRVIPAESYTGLPTADERSRAIVGWQQKARSLEAALEAERAARHEAEEALRVRDEFLSIASHELRTPLTSLSGHVQLLLRQISRDGQPNPERVGRSLEAIRDQSGKLGRLINQLLDISRLEAGKLALERVPTDLVALLEQAVAAARQVGEGHTFSLTAPASLQASVDPLRLEQVLTNLLDNAAKYSPEGAEIEVALARQGDWVELAVRDHGPGIPPEKRDGIFERFYQAHPDDYTRGLGLGLYISRQIVELHGGEIEAQFPEDGGTRFIVRLPLT